jgi:DNA polymerase alpha subunit A
VPYLCNKLTLHSRKWMTKYYETNLTCDDESCPVAAQTTRQMSVAGTRCMDPHCRGQMRPVYTDGQLYSQLSYYQYLFDVPTALSKLTSDKEMDVDLKVVGENAVTGHTDAYASVYNHVDKVLQQSARKYVDLGGLFARLVLG